MPALPLPFYTQLPPGAPRIARRPGPFHLPLMESIIQWFQSLDWTRLVPELIGKFLGVLLGLAGSWFLIFRRRLKALEKLRTGDSDDVLFQHHLLYPLPGTSDTALIFRSVAPRQTINHLYDNPVVRERVKEFADATSLKNPILPTVGTVGFEILNDTFGHIAGHLATMPFPRETWLFAMTCEDRAIVRKKCIRCFLIRPADLQRFTDWAWCRDHVRVEQPWHWFRVIALHQMALAWQAQQTASARGETATAASMPLVNDQEAHDRIRQMSVGLSTTDHPVGTPYRIPWDQHLASLRDLGLPLAGSTLPPVNPAGPPESFRHT